MQNKMMKPVKNWGEIKGFQTSAVIVGTGIVGCAGEILLSFRNHSEPENSNSLVGVHLTNRYHVAMSLFSDGSQVTSKCGKNKMVAQESLGECITDVLSTI